MKDKNIFKEKLYNHTLPVRDGLWEAIEAKLPPKKEDRVFPLFWFTLFASTLIGGALMFGTFQKNQSNNSLPANQFPTTNQNATDNSTVNSDANIQAGSSTSPTSSHSISSSDNSSDLSSISTPGKSSNHGNTILKTPSFSKHSGSGSKHTGKHENSSLPLMDKGSLTINATTISTSRHAPATPFLSPSEMNVSAGILAEREITALHPDPNCYKFSGNTDKYAFSADVFAGPGFSPRSFEATDGESSTYAVARETTEHTQYGWSAGARVNLLFRNGLGARLGLTYTQVGDIFDYTDTLATQSTTRVDSFFASDGTFLYADTSRVLIFGTLIKKIHNTYRYLDIPLLASFELPLGRSLLMVNAGPVFNLTTSHEGQILDPNLHPGTITPGEPGEIPVYKTSLGLSVYLGAGIVFPLTDHISGLVEPSLHYRLKPVTLDSYPLKEHRHYAGLNLGIRYHFD